MCKLDRGLMAPSNPAGSYPTPRPPHPGRLRHCQKDEGDDRVQPDREPRPRSGREELSPWTNAIDRNETKGEPKSGGSFGSERETRPNKGMQPTRYRARLMPGVGRLPPQLRVL